MKVKELETYNFYLIGDSDREAYYPAIIGIARDNSHIVYSFDKLVECFMLANNWTYEEAVEWTEYNTLRALPYYGTGAPEVVYQQRFNKNNKNYSPIKIDI